MEGALLFCLSRTTGVIGFRAARACDGRGTRHAYNCMQSEREGEGERAEFGRV